MLAGFYRFYGSRAGYVYLSLNPLWDLNLHRNNVTITFPVHSDHPLDGARK
jgi:hypothetical protein